MEISVKKKTKNILFIMFDQLRFDYLSCTGHPYLQTPNMDELAKKGVRFERAYVQSPICGSSRMSFYTGRYVHSHGAAWNNFPLKVGELTIGDHLRKVGMDTYLIGKTHMKVDYEGMERLGIKHGSTIGARVSECGFDVVVRDDGLWAQGRDGYYDERRSPYNEFLKSKGYEAENPWHDFANSGEEDDEIASGWLMANSDKPANIDEQDSETPWLTDRAIEFLQHHKDDEKPWLCHLSYIKPHWPYIVPAPYHSMYSHNQILPAVRNAKERENPHPVYGAFMDSQVSRSFQREEVRAKVLPAYMGLIKQCDDQLGRLFAWMKKSGQIDDTMIVITSDHGDYLGDHWMGEKDLFHDCSVRVPMIIYDPGEAADATRGSVCDELIESIDLAPTFLDAAGGEGLSHILEGRSLLPILHGEECGSWREFAVSEYDYSATEIASKLGVCVRDARLFMIVDKQWKFMYAEGGFRPMLFDLVNDPQELSDLGDNPEYNNIIEKMMGRLSQWARRLSQRTTVSNAEILARRKGSAQKGILIGVYDDQDTHVSAMEKYVGKSPKRIFPTANN